MKPRTGVSESHEILKVIQCAISAAPVKVHHEWRTISRGKYQVVAADLRRAQNNEVGFRIAATGLEANGFEINSGLNDAWYNPATDGQGFLISVFPDRSEMFGAWFTFDVERPPEDVMAMLGDPGHRWLTAQGPYSGDTATLKIFVTEGGVFDSAVPPASTDPDGDGTMVIEFADCTAGILNYTITSLDLSGEIPIQRIVLDNVTLCEALHTE